MRDYTPARKIILDLFAQLSSNAPVHIIDWKNSPEGVRRYLMKRSWFVVFCLSMAAWLLSACTMIRGSGEAITVRRDVSGFDQVALSGVGTLYITVGAEESLKVEAEDNLLPYIVTEVRGQTLNIGFKDAGWNVAIQPTEPIKYYLTVTDLSSLELSGAGNIEVTEIDTPEMRIAASGAGNIEIEKLTAEQLIMDVSGAGSCRIHAGEVQDQNLRISGAGGYQAADVRSQKVAVEISGMGGAKVWAEKNLSVEISGAGSVDYYGQPHISQEISGVGNIQSLGAKE